MELNDYQKRKKERTERFFKTIYKKKLITCTACNGSGYYDTTIRGKIPKCSSCNGTGKERER
jgi:DnaJ-class molecular chaperone